MLLGCQFSTTCMSLSPRLFYREWSGIRGDARKTKPAATAGPESTITFPLFRGYWWRSLQLHLWRKLLLHLRRTQRLQFLRGHLSDRAGRVVFLHLVVNLYGFQRLVGVFVETGQFELGSRLTHHSRRLLNQCLIEIDGLLRLACVLKNGSQCELGQAAGFLVPAARDLLQLLLSAGVVSQVVQGDPGEIARDAAVPGERVLIGDACELCVSCLGAFLARGVAELQRAGGRACPSNRRIVFLT